MRRTGLTLIPIKYFINSKLHKTRTNREVRKNLVDNDGVRLTRGRRKDLPSSGLTGFVFLRHDNENRRRRSKGNIFNNKKKKFYNIVSISITFLSKALEHRRNNPLVESLSQPD